MDNRKSSVDVTPAKAGAQSLNGELDPGFRRGDVNIYVPIARGWMFLFILGQFAFAAVPSEWNSSQEVAVSRKGNTRLKLPLETISQARPDLGDLRLVDAAGQEVAYLIDQPAQESAAQFPLQALSIRMDKGKTVLTGRVPEAILQRGYDALILETATDDFLKPVTLEGSRDGKSWVAVIRNYPIFKQPGQTISTSASFPKAVWPFLRVTLDDTATPAIRVSGLSVFSAARPIQNLDTVALRLSDVNHDPRETVIEALLPADHLRLDVLRIRTPESTYRRRVRVFGRTFEQGEFQDVPIGDGYIHRVQIDRQVSERVTVPLFRQVPGRQIVVRIDNGDTRPLVVDSITADVIPAYLVFDAPEPGTYALWSGHSGAIAKQYDVEALRASLTQAHGGPARLGAIVPNPEFKPPAPLPQVDELGTEIDVSAWPRRKKVQLQSSGLQRLELDVEALAHNQGRLSSLRLVRDGQQLPYIRDDRSVSRELIPALMAEATDSSKKSRWVVILPYKGLPISLMSFTVGDSLFQRNVTIAEDVQTEQGETLREVIGQDTWTRVKAGVPENFVIGLTRTPQSDRLIVEIDNGDNRPIKITSAKTWYPTPRILFKGSPGKDLYLYYGLAGVAAPQYDLQLIASEVLAAQPVDARLAPEEKLAVTPWWDIQQPTGKLHYAFWAVMILVVGILLGVIVKLLPEEK